jgi:hypothetical protein
MKFILYPKNLHVAMEKRALPMAPDSSSLLLQNLGVRFGDYG